MEQVQIVEREITRKVSSGGGWSSECMGCGNSWYNRLEPVDCGCSLCGSLDVKTEFEPSQHEIVVARIVCCPVCDKEIHSEYLWSVFATEPEVYLLACAVMHYRHEHVRYYDNGIEYHSRKGTTEEFKLLVNERAKRQIIRKAGDKLVALGVTPAHFARLQHTAPETIKLAATRLSSATPA